MTGTIQRNNLRPYSNTFCSTTRLNLVRVIHANVETSHLVLLAMSFSHMKLPLVLFLKNICFFFFLPRISCSESVPVFSCLIYLNKGSCGVLIHHVITVDSSRRRAARSFHQSIARRRFRNISSRSRTSAILVNLLLYCR